MENGDSSREENACHGISLPPRDTPEYNPLAPGFRFEKRVSIRMPQIAFSVLIISVIAVAGILGGLVNYFLSRKDDPDGSSFGKSVTLGIAAALLVPLFLNMISSTLLDSIRNSSGVVDLSKTLVFAGFCLVAAISSTAFIKTLSDRVLQEAREAKKVAHQADKKASEAQSAIQPIVEKETENAPSSETATALGASAPTVNESEKKLLQTLANGKWALRTRSGLSNDTGIAKPEVDKMVDDLKKRDLVDFKWIVDKNGGKRQRWYITNEGRAAIASD
jgi:hypothetical protein